MRKKHSQRCSFFLDSLLAVRNRPCANAAYAVDAPGQRPLSEQLRHGGSSRLEVDCGSDHVWLMTPPENA